MSPPRTVKLTVKMRPEHVDELRALAERRGVTMTEVLRHSIHLGKFLDDLQRDGGAVFVEDKSGRRFALVMP